MKIANGKYSNEEIRIAFESIFTNYLIWLLHHLWEDKFEISFTELYNKFCKIESETDISVRPESPNNPLCFYDFLFY